MTDLVEQTRAIRLESAKLDLARKRARAEAEAAATGEATHAKTRTQLAVAFGIPVSTFCAWMARPDAPRKTPIGWAVDEVAAFVEARRAESRARDRSPEEKQIASEKIREIKARADLAELKAARAKGEIVSREEWAADISRLVEIFRTAVEEIPRRVALYTTSPEARKAAEEAMESLEAELKAAALSALTSSPSTSASPDSPPESPATPLSPSAHATMPATPPEPASEAASGQKPISGGEGSSSPNGKTE